jgi:hypothetical protein
LVEEIVLPSRCQKMKKTFVVFSILLLFQFFGGNLFAQNQASGKTFKNSFIIHGHVSKEKLDFYTKSIETADLEQFRLKTVRLTLKFKNGFLLELIPAKDLFIKKLVPDIDANNYSDHVTTPNYKYPVFEILDSGLMTAEVQNNSK